MKRILFLAIISIVGILAISGCGKQKAYNIVFDANGGSGEMQSQTLVEGESLSIDDNSFVNDGSTFLGWNTMPDGSGVTYSNGQVITLASDIKLYAQWTTPSTIWVDLGLPSGTMWATCNVGATKPEDYGDYFAWGETSPKESYNWSTYLYCNGNYNTLTKYCTQSDFGNVDNQTTLDPVDDAATVNWGQDWRMPTKEEVRELYSSCTHEWTTLNDVNGLKFTGPNGNSIFIPAAGVREGSTLLLAGTDGIYWTKSLVVDYYPCLSWTLYFSNIGACYAHDGSYRWGGLPVRPVMSK